MVHLGQVQLALGEVERARATLSDAIALLRDEGDRTFLVMALTALAAAEQAAGADPEPILQEAMEEGARSRLPPVWTAAAAVHLARRAWTRGEVEAARRLLDGVNPRWLALPQDQAAFAELARALAGEATSVQGALSPDSSRSISGSSIGSGSDGNSTN